MNLSRLSVRDLEERARTVDAQIKKLEHRRRLTQHELDHEAQLKRIRVAVKDRLETLARP